MVQRARGSEEPGSEATAAGCTALVDEVVRSERRDRAAGSVDVVVAHELVRGRREEQKLGVELTQPAERERAEPAGTDRPGVQHRRAVDRLLGVPMRVPTRDEWCDTRNAGVGRITARSHATF